jgi:hypothetical protein
MKQGRKELHIITNCLREIRFSCRASGSDGIWAQKSGHDHLASILANMVVLPSGNMDLCFPGLLGIPIRKTKGHLQGRKRASEKEMQHAKEVKKLIMN